MNLSPLPVQKFFDNNGRPLVGGLLFTYEAGTSTPIATYTDSTGGTPNTNPVVLDFRGECRVWLDINSSYKFILSPLNDTDPPTNPIWTVDDITVPISIFDLTQRILGEIFYPLSSIEQSVGLSESDIVQPWQYYGDARRYGAVINGISDDRNALQVTISVAQAGLGFAYWPSGSYLINGTNSSDSQLNGVLIPYNGDISPIQIKTDGQRTKLLAGDNNMLILRVSSSRNIIGSMWLDGNGNSNVWGIGYVPEDMGNTTTVVNQNYNSHFDLYLNNMDEGVVMQCGPIPSGTSSGCWNGNYFGTTTVDCLRAIWLKDGTLGASGVNNHSFFGLRLGAGGNLNCNSGIYIECGSGNNFIGFKIEGVLNGTSPLANPTGVYVSDVGPISGTNSSNNVFYGFQIESSTRWIDNNSNSSLFSGGELDSTKIFGISYPEILTGLMNVFNSNNILLSVAGDPSKVGRIGNASGISSNVNGVSCESNIKLDGSQGNASLPSWKTDTGGQDASHSDTFSIQRRPAGGSFSDVFGIKNNGTPKLFSPTALSAGAAGAGTILPATPVGYFTIDIGGTLYKVPYYTA